MTIQKVRTEDIRITSFRPMPTPHELHQALPVSHKGLQTVLSSRESIHAILSRLEHRLMVIVGPCSIHDQPVALEFGEKLKQLADELSDELLIVMRTYFEKPRTALGWKGFINDPYLDDSFAIEQGLYQARELLVTLADMGVSTATEALDPIVPQYIGDLIAWTAIGARTAESQTHREMASGLSTPVGFKNATNGSIKVAANAIVSARRPHRFLGIDHTGKSAITETRGNPWGHLVLRGGVQGSNYHPTEVNQAVQILHDYGIQPANIIVDCSHANSDKIYTRQMVVAEEVGRQIVAGNQSIVGIMLESNLFAGQQSLSADPSQLQYGVSITDACLSWQESAQSLRNLAKMIAPIVRQKNKQSA